MNSEKIALVVMLTLSGELLLVGIVMFVLGLKKEYITWHDVGFFGFITALSITFVFLLSLPFWSS